MTTSKTPLVEVVTITPNGPVALGIVNAEQALALPDDLGVLVSHPDLEPGTTDVYVEKHLVREALIAADEQQPG